MTAQPHHEGFTARLATADDLDAIAALMERSIAELQRPFLNPEQIVASRLAMGLDTQLIRDGTYFLLESGGALAGCGGWSFRATLYGGDASAVAREPRTLDPAVDRARVRAMYTDPGFARRGVGRRVLALCEEAARAQGFRGGEMMATLAGAPLYRACGWTAVEDVLTEPMAGVSLPLIRMTKDFL